MTVFILSAGKGFRMAGRKPKQLLELCGETIMGRQVRQLKDHQIMPWVITGNSQIRDYMKSFQVVEPLNSRTILNTVLSTELMWTDNNLFLLGDVFYSSAVFKAIMEDKSSTRFWVSGSEIFAFKFDGAHSLIMAGAQYCTSQTQDCRLWHLYRWLHNGDIHEHNIFPGTMTVTVTDHTCDVDSRQQYEDLKQSLAKVPKDIL